MTAIKRKLLLGAGLLGLGLLGAAVAQGMMGGGMMGGNMAGGNMIGGGMMGTYAASSRPISQDEARRRAEGFAARYGQEVKIRDFMVFTENYYVQIVNSKTGVGLGELIVDRYTGVVQPEYGPNMVWNTRYGMGGGGMMGGNMMGGNMMGGNTGGNTMGNGQNQGAPGTMQGGQGMMGTSPNQGQVAPAAVRYNLAGAEKLAATFVTGYLPGGKVLEGLAFPGYYTFDYGRKAIEGMLSVNAYTGEVWVHGWHGLFLGEVK